MTAGQFRKWPNKAITLLGMSGVGKTTFSSKLPSDTWFHYSGDYRIGTKYLDEPILDNIKAHVMQNDFLRGLLLSDSIHIRNNITTGHLHPISQFLGMIGNPELGGLDVQEFKRRQALFRDAEVQTMSDVDLFMNKARQIYRYPHFVNDAGGSVCGLNDEECWQHLSEVTAILYLEASDEMEQLLLERAIQNPKPLFYENEFLDQHLQMYLEHSDLKLVSEIVPEEFFQWVFPRLMGFRRSQYQAIAHKYGYTINAEKILESRDEKDIIDLICSSMNDESID